MRSAAAAFVFALALLAGAAVGAAPPAAPPSPIPFKEEPALAPGTLGRVALVTAGVLAVLGAAAFALRRRTGALLPGLGAPGRIQILEVRRVGPGAALLLVRCDDREILIGHAKDGFAALSERRSGADGHRGSGERDGVA